MAIRTGDHFFFLFSFIQGLTFTVTSFHFILFHLISIKGFMSLWSHVWRKKQPTCLGCSHVPSAEPPVRTQDAGLPQVGSAGGLRRWAPAGGREPQPLACGPIPHFTCSYPPALGDTPPSRPVAGQKQALVANRHCQPKAGCTSHLSTSQEEEIALFLCIVENAKADTPKAPLNCFV